VYHGIEGLLVVCFVVCFCSCFLLCVFTTQTKTFYCFLFFVFVLWIFFLNKREEVKRERSHDFTALLKTEWAEAPSEA
jgi:hypothetical protein